MHSTQTKDILRVKSGLTVKVYPVDVVGLTTILLVECNLFGNTL